MDGPTSSSMASAAFIISTASARRFSALAQRFIFSSALNRRRDAIASEAIDLADLRQPQKGTSVPNELVKAIRYLEAFRARYDAGDPIDEHSGLTAAHLDAVLTRLRDTAHIVMIERLTQPEATGSPAGRPSTPRLSHPRGAHNE